MGRIIYVPFENLPQRYTQMWNEAIQNELTLKDLIIESPTEEMLIKTGEFLDVFGTIKFKARQLQKIAELFAANKIEDGDVFYVPDIFFPGIEAIKYMAELSDLDVRIATFNHAGRADKDDFVQKLEGWADTQELAWHNESDLIMAGSKFHANRIRDYFNVDAVVTGAIWSKAWMDKICTGIRTEKEQGSVIWPHRPCKEKGFIAFLTIAEANPDLKFYITSCGLNRIDIPLPKNVEYRYGLTKRRYFELFAKCESYLSTAYQETFGYTIQEAIYFGCKLVCPNRASYPEYVQEANLVDIGKMKEKNALTKVIDNLSPRINRQFKDNASEVIGIIRKLTY